MARTDFNGDLHINGALSSRYFNAPTGSIRDNDIESAANIAASKVQSTQRARLEQESATTAASERRVVHVVRGATATVDEMVAGLVASNIGAATVTIDLLKNGSTILTAPLVVDNSYAAYALASALIASPALVQDDVLEVDVVAVAGGGTLGTGLFVLPRISEDGI